MRKNIIVRADFCPDGKIIPISVTFLHKSGGCDSIMLKNSKIIKIRSNYKKYVCNAAGKDFYLSFDGTQWTYEDLNDIACSNHKYNNNHSKPYNNKKGNAS